MITIMIIIIIITTIIIVAVVVVVVVVQSNLPTTGLREAVRLSTTVRPLGTEYFLHVCNGFFDSK